MATEMSKEFQKDRTTSRGLHWRGAYAEKGWILVLLSPRIPSRGRTAWLCDEGSVGQLGSFRSETHGFLHRASLVTTDFCITAYTYVLYALQGQIFLFPPFSSHQQAA